MSNLSTHHRSWCAPSDCYTRMDGQLVHVGPDTCFNPAGGLATVRLVDRGDGIEVLVRGQHTHRHCERHAHRGNDRRAG